MNYEKNLAKFDIISKEGLRVSFILNDFQKRFLADISGKDIILKARQCGFSSLILGMFTLDFLMTANSRSVCISHDSPSSQKLLDRVKFFIQSLEDKGLGVNLKYNSRNEMVNSDKNSTFYIGAAGSKAFGRGDTINNLHLSEFAFYPEPEIMLSSVLQAVVPNGKVFIESTANGINFFKTFWDKSKRGETGFKTHFFDNSFYTPEFLDQKKKELGEQLFRQEYPSNDTEAFIFSGSPFFDMESLRNYLNFVIPPIKQGNFIGQSPPVFEDSDTGLWKIWETPKEHDYILSADVGETNDYCSAVILDRSAFKVVATFNQHLEASLFGNELASAGKYYHDALLAVEKNNQGLAVLQRLRDIYYPRLYTRQIIDSVTQNQGTDIGWLTTSKTRPLMLANLQTAIKQATLILKDEETIKEMMSFARNDRGRPEAVAGSHDDRVIALAIAVACYQTAPEPTGSFDQAAWNLQQEEERRLLGLDY